MDRSRATSHYVISGGFGAALFSVNFMLGATLTYITGIPGLSGVVTGLTSGLLLAIASMTSPRFGTVTIAFTLYCLLAVPTVLMGPPGAYKILVGFVSGLSYDVSLLLVPRNRIRRYFAWASYTVVILLLTYLAFSILELPGLQKFQKAVFMLFGIFLIEGFLGTYAGQRFFKKHLSQLSFVRELANPPPDKSRNR